MALDKWRDWKKNNLDKRTDITDTSLHEPPVRNVRTFSEGGSEIVTSDELWPDYILDKVKQGYKVFAYDPLIFYTPQEITAFLEKESSLNRNQTNE